MKKLDSEAPSGFFTVDARWRTKLRTGGFWLLLCPPLGWPLALGYRKAVILNLLDGKSPLLPEWAGNRRRFFLDGLRAIGVMFFYFMPFFALLWRCAVGDWQGIAGHWRELGAFFLMVAVLVPIGLPLLPITYFLCFSWFRPSLAQQMGLVALFLATTYVLPADHSRRFCHRGPSQKVPGRGRPGRACDARGDGDHLRRVSGVFPAGAVQVVGAANGLGGADRGWCRGDFCGPCDGCGSCAFRRARSVGA